MTQLNEKDVMFLLGPCVNATTFQFKDNYYKQQNGRAMGSPVSPILAEINMQKFEELHIKHLISLKYYRRYVDDSYAHVNSRNIQEALDMLSSLDPAIQFTMEV